MTRRRQRRRKRAQATSRGRVVSVTAGILVAMAVGFASLVEQRPPSDRAERQPEAVAPNVGSNRIRVELLNRGGVTGMAREATRIVRDAGLDVVDYGDMRPFDPESPSAVIDRVGQPELAEAVAATLGIDNVLSEPDPNLFVDVSVLLGSDWVDPAKRAPTGDDDASPGWWDPKRWVGG